MDELVIARFGKDDMRTFRKLSTSKRGSVDGLRRICSRYDIQTMNAEVRRLTRHAFSEDAANL